MVIVVSLPFIYFKAYCEYPKTGFYCNDESIAYPYRSISIHLVSFFRHLTKSFFRLFPIISISQKFFLIFFLTLEKIGIDEKVICYHNISN